MNEYIEIIGAITNQENIFTFLFIGLFLWQVNSHKKELEYYKNLVNSVLRVIQEDVNDIKERVNNKEV